MNRRTVLGVALAATVVIGACSEATVPSAATPSQAPAAVAPSVVPPSQAPTVVAPSVAPQSLAPAESPAGTIHLIEHPTNLSEVRVGSLRGCTTPTCQGDYFVGDDPMFDAATSKEVGTIMFECFLVDVGEAPCTTVPA